MGRPDRAARGRRDARRASRARARAGRGAAAPRARAALAGRRAAPAADRPGPLVARRPARDRCVGLRGRWVGSAAVSADDRRNSKKLTNTELVAMLGGLLLGIGLFIKWYEAVSPNVTDL